MRKIAFSIFLSLPVIAFALPTPPVKTVGEVKTKILCAAVSYLFTFAIIISVIFVLLAAFKYLTAGGDLEKVREAHRTLIYSAVAVAVAIVAGGVPYVVADLVGAKGSLGTSICDFSNADHSPNVNCPPGHMCF